jgi:regulator of sigma E protease
VKTFLFNALIFLPAISVLVAVHEFGHYWVARRIGVKVLRFSIGFGRVLWSRPLKDGTEFAISAIPIGGYVSMLGERDDNVPAREAHRALRSKSPSQRIAVMAAGPIANFLFALLIYWALFMVSSPGVKPVIGEVTPQSIAASGGLRTDDLILAVNGKEVATQKSAVIQIVKNLIADRVVNLRVAEKNSSPREIQLTIDRERVKELTEQDPLREIGFEFWYPRTPAKVDSIEPGGPAALGGLHIGDEIVNFDDQRVGDFAALQKIIEARVNKDVIVQVRRGGELVDLKMRVGEKVDKAGHRLGRLGIGSAPAVMPPDMVLQHDSVFGALQRAVEETYDQTLFVFQTVGYLVVGKVSLHSLSSAPGIAVAMGEAARIGFVPLLYMLALISITIGALNLLPIPVLDGGQIVFQVAELLKGRPVSERAQLLAQQVGITLLILLTALALFNDIVRLT